MDRKYWLLLSLAPFAAPLQTACSPRFHSCEERRNCAPKGGAGGATAGSGGPSAATAGEQQGGSAGGAVAPEGDAGAAGTGDGGSADGGDGGAAGSDALGTLCVPNQPTCDGNRATTCNADGTGYLAAGLKCSSKQTCLAGACEDQECTPSTSFCSGKTARKCADNGLSSNEEKTCGSSEYCDVATAICKTGVCAPSERACDGKRATLCTSTGDGYVSGGTVCKTIETCNAGECKPQVCTPNQSFCQGQNVKACSADGLSSSVAKTCVNQTCVASTDAAECKGVCAPGQQDCSNNGVRTCDANGQWGTPTKCANQACVGTGTTASCVGGCEPGQTQCAGGNGTQTCGASGTWSAATACAAATPVCAAGSCQQPVSCSGLAASCGAASESCCTSPLVIGGPFNRDNNASYPATVSSFRLDKYEVTVGRFRKFVAAVLSGWTPSSGSGKHAHLNGGAGLENSAAAGGYERGWDTAWTVDELPTNKATWDSYLGGSAYQTWTSNSGGNESLPLNRVSWYKALAFCIWDGGFLPSEAEWSYAAVGGGAQRTYPWGSAVPGMNANLAVYGCYLNGQGTCSGITNVAPVGSIPLGSGVFGQTDLAGNLGEWVLDGMTNYTANCSDCANLDSPTDTFRAQRGGSFDESVGKLASSYRRNYPPDWYIDETGLRCARVP